MALNTPVWEDVTDPDDLRALDPGSPESFGSPDVVVVGGGIVGLATAAMCVRRGVGRVVLLERGRLAGEVSGRAAGGLSPDTHALARPAEFVSFARTSLALYRELDAEWELGLRPLDWIIETPRRVRDETAARANGRPLSSGDAHDIEPELGDVAHAMLVPSQAHMNPLALAAALSRRAGLVATGVEVTGVKSRDGRLLGVRTPRGDVPAGAVVFATGSLPADVGPPSRRTKGHLLATAPAPFRLRAAVASGILVLQLADGRLVAGGTFDHGDDEDVVRDEVVESIVAEMCRLLPRAASLDITHRWCCFRPDAGDELPVIDRHPRFDNAWITGGHHRTGVLLAAATGDALASWIETSDQPDAVRSFALGSRFG